MKVNWLYIYTARKSAFQEGMMHTYSKNGVGIQRETIRLTSIVISPLSLGMYIKMHK